MKEMKEDNKRKVVAFKNQSHYIVVIRFRIRRTAYNFGCLRSLVFTVPPVPGSSSYQVLYVDTNFIRSLVRVCSEEHDLSD